MAEKTRYSDEELAEFKALILEKIELARRDYDQIMDALMNRSGNGIVSSTPLPLLFINASMIRCLHTKFSKRVQ